MMELMQRLQEIADAEFGGHFSIMRFSSSHWRVGFGTPMIGHSWAKGDVEMSAGATFEEAATIAIETRRYATCITFHDVTNKAEFEALDDMLVEAMAAEEANFERSKQKLRSPTKEKSDEKANQNT